MRIAHFGTFDVANYGDLLFPRIVEDRLRPLGATFVHVSPVGGRRIFNDVPVAESLASLNASKEPFDAVIVGGGNILHDGRTTLPDYRRVRWTAYPGLWMGAAALAQRCGAPLLVNAPGVPFRFGCVGASAARRVFGRSAYAAVRDRASAEVLEGAGIGGVRVVPDTALQIRAVLGEDPDATAVDRHGLAGQRYLAVHVNDRYGGAPAAVAVALDGLADATESRICLIGIGPCHGDDEYAISVASEMKRSPAVVPRPASVAEVASLVAGSAMYVGSSMHGFITACSYGVPAFLVADPRSQHKFSGLLASVRASNALYVDWGAAARDLGSLLDRDRAAGVVALADAHDRLDAHWSAMIDAIQRGACGKPFWPERKARALISLAGSEAGARTARRVVVRRVVMATAARSRRRGAGAPVDE